MFTGGAFLTTPIDERKVFCPETFSEMQQEFARAAEEFALNEILPRKKEIEKHDQQLSMQLIRSCGELGLLGVDVPETYGGLSMDKVTAALVAEKITYGQSESFMVTFSVQTGIGMLPIVYFGNETQRERFLPKLVSGEWLTAYALTEPGSGSDALSIRTVAHLSEDGKYYILNGNKQFISNGGWADLLITFAKVNGEKVTGFLIDPKSEGVIIHEEENKLGLHGSSTANIILENVKVPVENMLGEIGQGGHIAFNVLNIGRFKLGAAVLGGSKNALLESVKYALERRQFGQPIAQFEAIKKKIADMTIRSYALESIIYETAGLLDESIALVDENSPNYYFEVANAIEKIAMECSISKVYGSEVMWRNTDDGLQVFGGYGYIEDYPLAQMVRDTRVDRIYEGTNEINRLIITGYLLKKTLLEEVPIREKIKGIPDVLKGEFPNFANSPLAAEKSALEAARAFTLYVFNEALIRYGQDILNKQQVGEVISDMLINLFVGQTAVARISQHLKESSHPKELLAVAKVLIAEMMIEMNALGRKGLTGTLEGENLQRALADAQTFANYMLLPTNTFELKNEIADLVYRDGKYPF